MGNPKEEKNSKYVPFHVEGFVSFLEYESLRRKHSEEFINKLKRMPYKDYLSTPHWIALKKAILGRDGRTCRMCKNSHVEVHVHHLSYENRGNENISEVACLCAECHARMHGL